MGKKYKVNLPDIGEGVVEGEVIEWLKKEGDLVARDEAVVTVMTDKATVELPSPYAGILVKQYFKPGEVAKVDHPIYEIETEEEVAVQKESEQRERERPKKQFFEIGKEGIVATGHKAIALPSTRKLAKELGLQIDKIQGTGRDGRVTDADLIQFHASIHPRKVEESQKQRAAPEIRSSTPVQHLSQDEEVPVTGLRNIIAEKMVESKFIIPHFSYFDQADAARLIKLKKHIKQEAEKEGYRATYMPFFIRALSLTIQNHPVVNSSFDLQDHALVIHKHQNIGIAKNSENGLITCVLKDVQEMHLDEIIKAYDALMKKAESGTLTREEMIGSTITISNFGTLGGLFATPIINYPEAAILGIARIRKQPVVKNDQIVIREMLNLSWSFDHRIIDGDMAASISNTFIDFIQNPAKLL